MTTRGREAAETISLELRRGAIVLSVLGALHEEQYGYSLKQLLAKKGLVVPEGTLYPLLRRLEAQGLLSSRWKLGEGRPRRYYRISRTGQALLKNLVGEWHELVTAVARLLRDVQGAEKPA